MHSCQKLDVGSYFDEFLVCSLQANKLRPPESTLSLKSAWLGCIVFGTRFVKEG